MNARFLIAPTLALAFASGAASAGDMKPLFGGTIEPIDAQARFVMPVTAPYYNENSFITTDIRGWFVYHKFNSDALPNSHATDLAAQIRIALTDRLQLVAYKDGYLDLNGAIKDSGWNDLAAGLKWQYYRDDKTQLYAAVGAGYEFRTGESKVLQNDSEARFWASVDKGFGKFHTGLNVNYRATTSGKDKDNGNSDILSWHLHADYRLTEWFSPVAELNGYHVISDSNTGVALNGADVLNLGAKDADPTVTGALGTEFRAGENTAIRAAYEIPLSSNKSDLFGTRFTFSIIYTF